MPLDILQTEDSDRTYRIGNLPNIESVASQLHRLSGPFVLLLALDASSLTAREITASARDLINSGLAYLCVWGPDSEQVHDLVDQEIRRQIDQHDDKISDIMTTWHGDEPLSEAVWYFRNCAWPAETIAPHCKNWVAVDIDNPEWINQIFATFSSLS